MHIILPEIVETCRRRVPNRIGNQTSRDVIYFKETIRNGGTRGREEEEDEEERARQPGKEINRCPIDASNDDRSRCSPRLVHVSDSAGWRGGGCRRKKSASNWPGALYICM